MSVLCRRRRAITPRERRGHAAASTVYAKVKAQQVPGSCRSLDGDNQDENAARWVGRGAVGNVGGDAGVGDGAVGGEVRAAWPNTNVGGGAPTVGARDWPSWAGASEASAVVMVLPTGRLDAPRW